MIHHVDRALEQFFRDVVAVPAETIDISFHAPEPAWTAGLTRPTIDVFLWDVRSDDTSKRAGMDEEQNPESGRRRRRPPAPVVTLRYLVTVWTREHRDEHELLGSILTSVLGNRRIPDSALPDALAGTRCSLAVAGDDHHFPHELWSGPAVKAAVNLEVSLPVEAVAWQERGKPVEVVAAAVYLEDAVHREHAGHREDTVTGAETADVGGNPGHQPEPGFDPVIDLGSADPTSIRRRRQHGALVMEGRAQPESRPRPLDTQ